MEIPKLILHRTKKKPFIFVSLYEIKKTGAHEVF